MERNKNQKVSGYSFLTITTGESSQFNEEQLDGANEARQLYQAFGFPRYKRFFWLLQKNKITDCNVTLDDTKRAIHLHGP